jgi:hypothetical protein
MHFPHWVQTRGLYVPGWGKRASIFKLAFFGLVSSKWLMAQICMHRRQPLHLPEVTFILFSSIIALKEC